MIRTPSFRRRAFPVHAALAALVAALSALPACSSSREEDHPRPTGISEEAPAWVFDAAHEWDEEDQPFVYYATGRAAIHMNIGLAEENARADALADVQSFLETTIERLNENWASEAGDLLDRDALTSYINDEQFTREVISGSLSGARVIGKWNDDDHYFVWVRYNAEDAFLGNYSKGVASRLREQTRELTTADRERMRRELERVVQERNGEP
jgi:hypothetical protein